MKVRILLIIQIINLIILIVNTQYLTEINNIASITINIVTLVVSCSIGSVGAGYPAKQGAIAGLFFGLLSVAVGLDGANLTTGALAIVLGVCSVMCIAVATACESSKCSGEKK